MVRVVKLGWPSCFFFNFPWARVLIFNSMVWYFKNKSTHTIQLWREEIFFDQHFFYKPSIWNTRNLNFVNSKISAFMKMTNCRFYLVSGLMLYLCFVFWLHENIWKFLMAYSINLSLMNHKFAKVKIELILLLKMYSLMSPNC